MDITNEMDAVPELHKLPKTATPTSRAKRGPSNRVEPLEKVEVYKIDYDRLLSENEALKESNAKLYQIILKNSELEEEKEELMAQKQCLTQELSLATSSNNTDETDHWMNSKQERIPELEQQRLEADVCKNCKQELGPEKQSLPAAAQSLSSSFSFAPGSSGKMDEADISTKNRLLEEEKSDMFAYLFSYFLVFLFALNISFICLYPDQAIRFIEDVMAITTTKFQEGKDYVLNILE